MSGIPRPLQHCTICGHIQQYATCIDCKKKQRKQNYQTNKHKESERAKNNQYYRSAEWRRTREYVINRDYQQCVLCQTDQQLEVHHIIERAKGGNDTPSNLVTLCKSCHTSIGNKNKQKQAQLNKYLGE